MPPGNRPYFRPNERTIRGQTSKIVSNAAGFTEPVTGQFYTDVTTDNPFYNEIMRLTTRGVISGYPCGFRVRSHPGFLRVSQSWGSPTARYRLAQQQTFRVKKTCTLLRPLLITVTFTSKSYPEKMGS